MTAMKLFEMFVSYYDKATEPFSLLPDTTATRAFRHLRGNTGFPAIRRCLPRKATEGHRGRQ
jgi:hypothetical protein